MIDAEKRCDAIAFVFVVGPHTKNKNRGTLNRPFKDLIRPKKLAEKFQSHKNFGLSLLEIKTVAAVEKKIQFDNFEKDDDDQM
jgi:hypothetical protein